jgi:hypothetical protein
LTLALWPVDSCAFGPLGLTCKPRLWRRSAMAPQTTTDDRLDGWEAISHYLGWAPRTVIRWEKQKGLPLHRVSGGKRQPVYAYRHELDLWFQKNGAPGLIDAPSPALSAPEPDTDLRRTPNNGALTGARWGLSGVDWRAISEAKGDTGNQPLKRY